MGRYTKEKILIKLFHEQKITPARFFFNYINTYYELQIMAGKPNQYRFPNATR